MMMITIMLLEESVLNIDPGIAKNALLVDETKLDDFDEPRDPWSKI